MFRVISDRNLNGIGKTLVLPSVSVGNSGTLALDLLLNSPDFSRIGWVYSTDFLPIIGLDALDSQSNVLNTPLELFEGNGLIIMQIRSLCTDPKGFIDRLLVWGEQQGFLQIIVVGSNWDEMKASAEEAEIFFINNSRCKNIYEIPEKSFADYKDFFTGTGLTERLLSQEKISASAVMVYGRDVPADVQSAFRLGEGLINVLKTGKLTVPRSWQGIMN